MSQYTTYPICLIPFLDHNDPTRCQMSASQIKQSLRLVDPDIPDICTGYEDVNHLQLHTLNAPEDGEIIFKNQNIIIINYVKKGYEYYRLHPFYKIYFNTGDKIKKDDIVFEYDNCDKGLLKFGKNVLVAYGEYFGFCYEDSIVISESAAEKFKAKKHDTLEYVVQPSEILLSLSNNNYKPIPEIGEIIKKNDPIFLKKKYTATSIKTYFDEPEKQVMDKDIKIENIEIYVNTWNNAYPDFNNYIISILNESEQSYKNLHKKLKNKLSEDDLSMISQICNVDIHKKVGKYDFPGIKIRVTYSYEKPVEIGDKFANRHSNKGIVSKIVPDKDMPVTPWGQTVDVVLGFLSIISRMNIGQVYEIHASLALRNYKNMLLEQFDRDPVNTIETMIKQLKDIDCTNNKWYTKMLENTYKKYGANKQLIEDLVLISPPFEIMSIESLNKFMSYSNTQKSYSLTIKGKETSKALVGYSYIMRLVHTTDKKLAMRSVGKYTMKTLQPMKSTGAQRIGEMEIWAFMAYDAINNLLEINVKSDDMINKINVLRKMYNTGFSSNVVIEKEKIASLHLLKTYSNVLGMNF